MIRGHLWTGTLAALLIMLTSAYAQDRSFGFYDAEFSPDITILNSSPSQIRFNLDMSRLQPTGQIDLAERLPGTWADMNYEGVLMPRFTFFLALPPTGNPTVQIEDWQTIARSAVVRSIPENTQGISHAVLGNVGIVGGVRVVPVTIKPVTYTNLATSCQIMSEATIAINIDGQNGDNPLTGIREHFSEPWQKLLQATVTNWQDIPNITSGEPSHILMFVPQEWQATLSGFITWKEQRGYKVTVVPTSEVDDDNALRDRIISEMNAVSPRVDHVIFVGDENTIPDHYEFTSDPFTRFSNFSYPGNFTDENYFAAVEGTDVFPDLFLGRWVVNTVSEVQRIAVRTIDHEKDTFEYDSLRFEHAAVSADYTEITQRMTKQHARQIILQGGVEVVDTLWGDDNPSPQPLLNWLSDGISFVNYRGSGWTFGWAGISFYVGSVQQINNQGRLPIVTGIGCGVGKFDEADNFCFGEAWMTAGSGQTQRGSVGFIGPCWNTHTAYNDNLDTCLYRAMFDHRVKNLGAALAAGKMFHWALFNEFVNDPDVLEVEQTLFRQYLLLCDPSLQVFTDTPERAHVTVPGVIPAGPYNMPVYIADGASLSADSLSLTLWTGPGQATTYWIPTDVDFVTVPVDYPTGAEIVATMNGENTLSLQWNIAVGVSGPYLLHAGIEISDEVGGNGDARIQPGESLYIADTCWNIGSDAAFVVVGSMSSPTPGVTILEGNASYGNLAQGDRALGQPFYHCSVAETGLEPGAVAFRFTYSANGVEPRTDSIYATLYMPNLLESGLVIDDANQLLERGEETGIILSLVNNGNETLLPGTITISTTDEFLIITDATGDLPQIAQGATLDLPSSELRVAASTQTPSGHVAPLHVEVVCDMGSYTYETAFDLTVTIGQVSPSDPTAGNDSLYWIYDNTDVIYSRAPVYDWFEISPTVDGPGALIDVTQGNQVNVLPVPFSYNFFGQSFSSLSVSVDGWVSPIETLEPDFQNGPLPRPSDIVDGLIAVLWNDYWAFSGEQGDVSYFYDSAGDRFIIEWRNLSDWQTGAHPSTFQVQLLNPATYPTPTGDAEWLFMYQDLAWHANGAAGATVGYENLQSDRGVTYYYPTYHDVPGAAELENGRALRLTTYPPVLVSADDAPPVAMDFQLHQNYPNPFNPETTLSFTLPRSAHVTLDIYNLLGQRVARLMDESLSSGLHSTRWIGRDESGAEAPSGIYFYRLATPFGMQTRRMLLLK